MRDRIYFWIEDNAICYEIRTKFGISRTGLQLTSEGCLQNHWQTMTNFRSLDEFIGSICENKNIQFRGKIKSDMRDRYLSILSKLSPVESQ